MKRRLFTILWVSSLLIFVLLGALWVRSYWYLDEATYVVPRPAEADTLRWSVDSSPGVLSLGYLDSPDIAPLAGLDFRTRHAALTATGRWGFGYLHRSPVFGVVLWRLEFPHWAPMLAAAVLPAVGITRARRRQRRKRLGLCLKCGYDLRGSKERCPECGTAIPAQHPMGTAG